MSYKLLFVDDSVAMQRIVQITLGRENFKVEVAKDGGSALAWLEQETCDLVLISSELPDMSGFEVCKHATMYGQTRRQPPLLVLMAHSHQPLEPQRLRECGATAVIYKPFASPVLAKRLNELLKQRDATNLQPPASTIVPLVSPTPPALQPLATPLHSVEKSVPAAHKDPSRTQPPAKSAELEQLVRQMVEQVVWEVIPDKIDHILHEIKANM